MLNAKEQNNALNFSWSDLLGGASSSMLQGYSLRNWN